MWLRALLRPVLADERSAATARWRALPRDVRTPDQVLGRHSAGCAATWGVMERCDFACTACYLSHGANAMPPLPFSQVKEQLDTIREHLGPFGATQITAGEVTLLAADELVRILCYCREIELTPMVMTHGQRFVREPEYLERLVNDGGLDRVAIHVDTTQRGRDGGDPTSETELHAVRAKMAEVVRDTRRRTGRTLHAAHTVTVTRDNLRDLASVVRWTVHNADAFRLLSLQPVAQVGRTRTDSNTGRRGAVWEAVCEGVGRRIHPQPWLFGHPDCNQVALFFVVRTGKRRDIVEVTRDSSRIDRWFLRRLLHGFAGFSGGSDTLRASVARVAGRLLRNPRLLLEIPLYCLWRALGEWRLALRMLVKLPWVRIRPFAIVVHHFMDTGELETETGRARVEACSFRVPVNGEMVSMCEFNGRLRASAVASSVASGVHDA